jgi:hypothetical protein
MGMIATEFCEEVAKASRQYASDQGQVPTAVAYQAGARCMFDAITKARTEVERLTAILRNCRVCREQLESAGPPPKTDDRHCPTCGVKLIEK